MTESVNGQNYRELAHDRYESLIINTFLFSGAIAAGAISLADSVKSCAGLILFWTGVTVLIVTSIRFHFASFAIFKALFKMSMPAGAPMKEGIGIRLLRFVFRSDNYSLWHDIRNVRFYWHISVQVGVLLIALGYGISRFFG